LFDAMVAVLASAQAFEYESTNYHGLRIIIPT
jgi:hypothetical protein